MLVARGLDRVLGDLAALGYDARWTVMGAADVGAPHQRDRLWILASLSIPNADLQSRSSESWQQQQRPAQSERGCAEWVESRSNVAHADSKRQLQQEGTELDERGWIGDRRNEAYVADTNSAQRQRNQCAQQVSTEHADIGSASWWKFEPDVGRVADGVAHRTHRLKAIGNGQVPQCAAAAWRYLINVA